MNFHMQLHIRPSGEFLGTERAREWLFTRMSSGMITHIRFGVKEFITILHEKSTNNTLNTPTYVKISINIKATNGTGMTFVPRVYFTMGTQVGEGSKRTTTRRARKWHLSSVKTSVRHQRVFSTEDFTTNVAHKIFVTRMLLFMHTISSVVGKTKKYIHRLDTKTSSQKLKSDYNHKGRRIRTFFHKFHICMVFLRYDDESVGLNHILLSHNDRTYRRCIFPEIICNKLINILFSKPKRSICFLPLVSGCAFSLREGY